MIKAKSFIDIASDYGFNTYSGVPCSFLTPLINEVISNDRLEYIPASNEGDAVAIASGVWLGNKRGIAMMQNSGLGNAVSPLTSLNFPFKIPVLVICTLRGEIGLRDEPQHELMGQITTQLFEDIKVPWEYLPTKTNDLKSTFRRIDKHFKMTSLPFALIMKKGTCKDENRLEQKRKRHYRAGRINQFNYFQGTKKPTRRDILSRLIAILEPKNSVILTTTGFSGRELYKVKDNTNQFYMVGSMGCVPSLSLGLAISQPSLKVFVIDGDGAALMRLGNFATIGSQQPKNYFHLLLDNESHESTGGQNTYSNAIDFAGIAFACGYKNIIRCNFIKSTFFDSTGPTFIHIKTKSEKNIELPRPSISPAEQAIRLRDYLK